ncbi:helix-turn-helix domain-containing protein [Actinoplanes sp. HUAS TT8]|uniref:helix-turn-helix domain-containing protein n=1 Tax=Actinoplanes sp. HUAS TT8 TaxID=3447453 RepID=UPI003F522494
MAHIQTEPAKDRLDAELWTVEETAAFLRTSVGTLYQWRHRRKGPPAAKPGRHLLYDPADVRAWFRSQVA